MASKSFTDLRTAIADLDIKKPFDLRSQGKVTFTHPKNELDPSEDTQNIATEVERTQNEHAQIKLTQSEHTQIEPTQNEQSQIEHAQNKPTHLSHLVAPPARKTPQGYFRLAHAVFSDPKLRRLPGDAFRIYLWMASKAWRFESSDGTLRASVNYITEATGVSRATVTRCLPLLKTEKLIELIQVDYNSGNIWKVQFTPWSPDEGGSSKNEGAQSEPTQNEDAQSKHAENKPAQNDHGGGSKRACSVINLSLERAQNEHEVIKYSKNSLRNSKNSLSTEPLSPEIQDYLTKLKPARKRESESGALRELLRDYCPKQIVRALAWLTKNGLPGSGEPCHSPFSFCLKGMGQILKLAEDDLTKCHTLQKMALQTENNKAKVEAEEEAAFLRMQEAFGKAFPTAEAQDNIVTEYQAQLNHLPFRGEALKNIVISKWWNESNSLFHASQ